jgi:hypothetical protein
MPRRLLDLGDSASDPHVRLVISAEHFQGHNKDDEANSRTHNFITLRHRWGRVEMPKLETSNESTFRQSIAFEVLPKTFQHAIELTRQLNVRYLWIDAMCIIKDSSDDWLSEGATMANVYTNAYCNIAASSATDSNGGLFYARNPNLVSTSFVQPMWSKACQRVFAITPPAKSLREMLNAEPLLQRGWVLQERFLAAQVLHFTTDGIYFECQHHFACGIYLDGIPHPHEEYYPSLDCKAEHSIHRVLGSEDEGRSSERKDIME